MAITTYLSIITLNISGLNALIKRPRVTECIKKKTRTMHTLPTRGPLKIKRHTQTKCKVIEKDISCKSKLEKGRVAKLISDTDFKTMVRTKDKEGIS